MAPKPEFRMWAGEDGVGVWCMYTNSRGTSSTSYFNNPSASIAHVDIVNLRDRFTNIKNVAQVNYVKRRYDEEIGKFLK